MFFPTGPFGLLFQFLGGSHIYISQFGILLSDFKSCRFEPFFDCLSLLEFCPKGLRLFVFLWCLIFLPFSGSQTWESIQTLHVGFQPLTVATDGPIVTASEFLVFLLQHLPCLADLLKCLHIGLIETS